MVLILIIIAALAVLFIGGIWMYNQRNNKVPTSTQSSEDLNKELDALDTGDIEQDFTQVDKDLQNL